MAMDTWNEPLQDPDGSLGMIIALGMAVYLRAQSFTSLTEEFSPKNSWNETNQFHGIFFMYVLILFLKVKF